MTIEKIQALQTELSRFAPARQPQPIAQVQRPSVTALKGPDDDAAKVETQQSSKEEAARKDVEEKEQSLSAGVDVQA